MTKANTATIGHNIAPEEVTLEQIALGAFSSEKKSDAAVKSKEVAYTLLLDRLTADGAVPGFNTKLEDGTYNEHATVCRMALVTSKGSRAAHVWTTEVGLSEADTKLKSSLIKTVGSRMSKLSKALDKHQNKGEAVSLTFTERLIKGVELAHYRLGQYDMDKHGETTFKHNDVKATLEKLLVQLNK